MFHHLVPQPARRFCQISQADNGMNIYSTKSRYTTTRVTLYFLPEKDNNQEKKAHPKHKKAEGMFTCNYSLYRIISISSGIA